ncbi:MAG TPA: cytochrome c maturation protein CcmE [Bryobacteraceae bacterium]|nr:cytochrome c maturation protein CcmE [Bryobacteraceae bacterium]
MKTYAKFAALVIVIIGTLAWLAVGGISDTKTYYKTIAEVQSMGDRAHTERLRVGGDVEKGSIIRDGKHVRFTLKQDALQMNVVYSGIEPLPDTFRDGAQALADGRLRADGVFQATKIQAKCASKYEAKPMQKPAVQQKQAAL